MTDPLGKITSFGYDGFGNLTSVKDANGHTVTLSYNANNYLTGLRNARGNAWAWSYWNAAQAAAQQGQLDAALKYLEQTIDRGFTDVERIRASQLLKPLHGSAGWEALLARLTP